MTTFLYAVAILAGVVGAAVIVWYFVAR